MKKISEYPTLVKVLETNGFTIEKRSRHPAGVAATVYVSNDQHVSVMVYGPTVIIARDVVYSTTSKDDMKKLNNRLKRIVKIAIAYRNKMLDENKSNEQHHQKVKDVLDLYDIDYTFNKEETYADKTAIEIKDWMLFITPDFKVTIKIGDTSEKVSIRQAIEVIEMMENL